MPDSPPPIGFHPSLLPLNSSLPFSYSHDPHQLFLQNERQTSQTHPDSSSSSSSSSSSDDEAPIIELPMNFGGSWQHCSAFGPFPDNMVRAGVDADNDVIFVGRAFHNGNMLPAKVIPNKNVAFVSYDGEEFAKEDFEVLRHGTFVWEYAENGVVPEGAVEVGRTREGEKLFMGRALYQGTHTPGKVHPSHGCLYIPFEGSEVSLTEYEVLCIK